jgi:murein DD-endopeptidase MepM/ murein hydrolase activator NlpD
MSNPGLHPHGAIDIATDIGSKIIAPEKGALFLYWSQRIGDGIYWPDDGSNPFPWRNYFYDMFGGVIVLKGESGRSHLFAHIYINQLYNKKNHSWTAIEESADKRFPLTAMLAGGIIVEEGELIGWTGDAGFSTGPHCHYEIHKGFSWERWESREDPEKIDWEY